MPVEAQHPGKTRHAGVDERAGLASRRCPADAWGADACVSGTKGIRRHRMSTSARHELAAAQKTASGDALMKALHCETAYRLACLRQGACRVAPADVPREAAFSLSVRRGPPPSGDRVLRAR